MKASDKWHKAQDIEFRLWRETACHLDKCLWELVDSLLLDRFIKEHLKSKDDLNVVLEIGIGPLGIGWGGIFADGFMTGVDPLPRIKVQTRRKEFDNYVLQLQQRVGYIRALGEMLPFMDDTFDAVVCDNVIDHTQHANLILEEARRITKPKGYLILGVNCFSILGLVKWRFYATKRLAGSSSVLAHPRSYLEKDVVRLVKNAGFGICVADGKSILKYLIGHQYRFCLIAQKKGGSI